MSARFVKLCWFLPCVVMYCAMVTMLGSVHAGEKITHSVISAERIAITADGKPFTEVLADFRGTPILFPLVTPKGVAVTRVYPMGEVIANGSSDHPHHRSLWFTHGDVCGIDFWSGDQPNTPLAERKRGIVREVARSVATDAGSVIVGTRNIWIVPTAVKPKFAEIVGNATDTSSTVPSESPLFTGTDVDPSEGTVLCVDVRTFRFSSVEVGGRMVRQIDMGIKIIAKCDGVRFGDTKEGTFGIRVHDAMRIKGGGKQLSGTVTNAERFKDGTAWGRASAWCDYRGEIDGQRVGITILHHPQSFHYPTYWHVRDYGLFAANPFGMRDFTKSGDGSLVLRRGENFEMSYRVLLTDGDWTPDAIDAMFQSYVKEGTHIIDTKVSP